jgi:hypothetical protein
VLRYDRLERLNEDKHSIRPIVSYKENIELRIQLQRTKMMKILLILSSKIYKNWRKKFNLSNPVIIKLSNLYNCNVTSLNDNIKD